MGKRGSFARVLALAAAGPARAAGPGLDWPQYLGGPQHDSVSAAAAFTPSNAASAHRVWHWQPPVVSGEPAPVPDASPTVVAGRRTSARKAATFMRWMSRPVRWCGPASWIPGRT